MIFGALQFMHVVCQVQIYCFETVGRVQVMRCGYPQAPFTRYNLLSNRFDNRLYRVGYSIQPAVKPVYNPV